MRTGATFCALGRVGALIAAVVTATPCAGLSLYQIGNSLTSDATPGGVATLLRENGPAEVENGFHIRGASSLETLWANPQSTSAVGSRHGGFPTALPAHAWDHVTFQPFRQGGSNYADDLQAIRNFVDLAETNPANADTKYYLYATWPSLARWDDWEAPVPDRPNPPTAQSRAYYRQLYDELEANMPGRWAMIPAGEVFFEVGRRAEAGQISGLSSLNDLYRDSIHASTIGRFLAVTTVSATVLQQDPSDWVSVAGVPGYPSLSTDLASQLQSIVWDILAEEPRSRALLRGDFDRDGAIASADYDLWSQTYGFLSSMPTDLNGDYAVDSLDVDRFIEGTDPGRADIDRDGVADADDRQAWRDAFGPSTGPADVNADGRVDAADYSLWRDAAELGQLTDVDADGRVGLGDLVAIRREFGRSRSLFADPNQSGRVDAADYTIWRDGFAATDPPASVPQPSGVALSFAGVVGAMTWVGRR